MRRGPLLGIFVFLTCTLGGYKLGLYRRDVRLRQAQENLERAAQEAIKPVPVVEPVAISTEALSAPLPSDFRRGESVPKVLE